MKLVLSFVLLAGIAYAKKETNQFHETEEEFEEEFNIAVLDPTEKFLEAQSLKVAEDEINQINNANLTFKEKLYAESNLPPNEFDAEKFGNPGYNEDVNLGPIQRSLGAIVPPPSMRNNPQNAENLKKLREELDAMDRNLPSSVDSTKKGIVTVPRNQGNCASCAAFASTSLHELCMRRAGAPSAGLDLSEQYLIDCGFDGWKMKACDGGWSDAYSQWFVNNGGVSLHENSYPYLANLPKKTCAYARSIKKWNSGAKVTKTIFNYDTNNEEDLMKLVNKYGGVVVLLYAGDRSLQNLASGVYYGCSKNNEWNHAVMIVGYGTEKGMKYWKVKNSWGDNWAEGGFFKIRRGTNECGIEKRFSMVAECSYTGRQDPVPADAISKSNAIPCDLKRILQMIKKPSNGKISFRLLGKDVKIMCKDYMCYPEYPGITNTCQYVCGMDKC